MKKLFTSLVLLMIGVVATYAANYDLYVAGKQVTSSNAGNIMAGISYDASNKTLTLNNCTLNAGSNYAIRNTGIAGLKIRIVGTCSVTSSTDVFVFHKNTVVAGDLNNAGATLTAETTGETAAVFWAEDESEMCIYNLYLTAKGVKYCLFGYNYNEEAKYSKLFMSCVEMTATVSEGTNGAVAGFLSASFDEGDAYLVEGAYNTTKHAVYASSSSTSPLKQVRTRGGLYVGGIIVRVGLEATKLSPSGLSKGTISYDGKKTLTLDGVTYSSSKRFMDNYKIDGLKVVINGINTLNNNSNYCIRSNRSFSVEGSNSTYSSNKLTVGSSFYAIYQNDYQNEGMTLLLKNLTLDLKGAEGVIGGASDGATDLTINNCKITAKYTGTSSTVSAIKGFKSCTLTGVDVKSPNYSWFRAAKKEFQNASGYASNPIEIDVPTTWYDVYVLGSRISNLNTSAFGREGMTGTAKWDNSNKKLDLTGVQINSTTGDHGIKVNVANTKVVIGNNTSIVTKGNALWANADGIQLLTETTPTENMLFKTTGDYSAIYIEKNYNLTLNVASNKLKIEAAGSAYAVAGSSNGGSKLTIKKNGNTIIKMKGGKGTINNLDNLDLSGTMDFWYSGQSEQTPGCYFNNGRVFENGGNIVKDKYVAIAYIETKYDLYVGGTQVTDCNAGGIGSKYITAGGGTAVKYIASSSKLTLNGATIDCGSDMVNPIRNTGVSGLTVELMGKNVFKDSNSGYTGDNCAFYTKVNTTVTGSGSLDATANKPIMVAGGTFTFKDAKDVKARNIQAQNETSGAKLVVNNSNVTFNGRVSFFDNVTWPNSKLLTPADGYYDTGSRRLVNGSGVIAEKVVFGDKNSTAIDGIEVDTDAEVIGIYDVQGRKLDEMQPGINIIRMSNGTTRKVVK